MDLQRYLDRIAYRGQLQPSAIVLRDLQLAHLLTVPFENLSIHIGEPIVLHDEALFDKIVVRRRGGFCYEANGLFAALLRAMGFDAAMLSSCVARADGTFSPEFDHLTLMVRLEERWLADVGFGDTFREPLRIDVASDQIQGHRAYRIVPRADDFVLMQREGNGPWSAQYRFTLRPRAYRDFYERCRYQETSPDSHFAQNRICTLATRDGRVTLSGMRLIETSDVAGRTEREVHTQEEYDVLLRERFGIRLAPQRADR